MLSKPWREEIYIQLNANIYFNRSCKELKVVQKYAKTKIKSHKIETEHLTDKIKRIRINNEIKYWYMRKQLLNKVI
jgi:hypothetical protein